MTFIYSCKTVEKVAALYGDLLKLPSSSIAIAYHLKLLVFRLWNAFQEGNENVQPEISNYHPDYLGKSWDTIKTSDFSLVDAYHTIAREYGYKNWFDIESLDKQIYDVKFEQAVNMLLNGNLSALKKQINQTPSLLHKKSNYGHQATLLHYVASNGCELWRQKVPLNLPEITAYLLSKGADKQATMQVYNGQFTPLQLLTSSAHPANAGILPAMEDILS